MDPGREYYAVLSSCSLWIQNHTRGTTAATPAGPVFVVVITGLFRGKIHANGTPAATRGLVLVIIGSEWEHV